VWIDLYNFHKLTAFKSGASAMQDCGNNKKSPFHHFVSAFTLKTRDAVSIAITVVLSLNRGDHGISYFLIFEILTFQHYTGYHQNSPASVLFLRGAWCGLCVIYIIYRIWSWGAIAVFLLISYAEPHAVRGYSLSGILRESSVMRSATVVGWLVGCVGSSAFISPTKPTLSWRSTQMTSGIEAARCVPDRDRHRRDAARRLTRSGLNLYVAADLLSLGRPIMLRSVVHTFVCCEEKEF
jgi:hypothetical protein